VRLALLALLGAALLGGCAQDLTALATDKNALCIVETSVWETVRIDRNWGCEQQPAEVKP
jgi:hypothetical protein